MSKPPRIPAVLVRKVVALPPALWERVNGWRHDRRVRTEVEGVRHLIERGLDGEAEIARLRARLAAAGVDPDGDEGGTP